MFEEERICRKYFKIILMFATKVPVSIATQH